MKQTTATVLTALLLLLAPSFNVTAQVRRSAAPKDFQLTWLGHAALEIVSPGGTRLLIDPFLKETPATPAEFKDLARYKPAAILITHSHGDHLGDAMEIAKASGAKIVSIHMPQLFEKE